MKITIKNANTIKEAKWALGCVKQTIAEGYEECGFLNEEVGLKCLVRRQRHRTDRVRPPTFTVWVEELKRGK